MVARLAEQLAALATMPPARLRIEWQRQHKTPAPRFSPDLLMRGIAWRLQERTLGGLPPSMARELLRLASSKAAGDGGKSVGSFATPTNAADLRPGTTLMRSWGDRTWSVMVTEDGLVFDGRRYASLSKIAREITGAHWSGPRFFGVKPTPATTGAAARSEMRRVRGAAAAAVGSSVALSASASASATAS